MASLEWCSLDVRVVPVSRRPFAVKAHTLTRIAADVGGFFGNPEAEMMVRWYQVGAFSPFFRAHGHIGKCRVACGFARRRLTLFRRSDTKRREPYLFDQPHQGYIRDSIRLRYTLLPALYTAFYEASLDGTPILRYACSRLSVGASANVLLSSVHNTSSSRTTLPVSRLMTSSTSVHLVSSSSPLSRRERPTLRSTSQTSR